MQTAIHTRRGIERILRFGFELALSRRQHLTMITKSNAQKYGFVLWDEVLDEIRGEYPSVEVDKQHVDAAAMNMVRSPEWFDVMVTSEPLWRHPLRDRVRHRRRAGPGAQRQHQPRARLSRPCLSRRTARRRTLPGRVSPTP